MAPRPPSPFAAVADDGHEVAAVTRPAPGAETVCCGSSQPPAQPSLEDRSSESSPQRRLSARRLALVRAEALPAVTCSSASTTEAVASEPIGASAPAVGSSPAASVAGDAVEPSLNSDVEAPWASPLRERDSGASVAMGWVGVVSATSVDTGPATGDSVASTGAGIVLGVSVVSVEMGLGGGVSVVST
ncbi:MAG TPA: hypothetical protein VNR42_03215, partial [Solirubrobacteraceae bacterium]|nr:hypothetical protein [Solirubrobacteraceae bacterium]